MTTLTSKLLFILIALGIAFQVDLTAQEPGPKGVYLDHETYLAVLNLVFPRDPGNFKDEKIAKEYSLVLRFRPQDGPELQIKIDKYNEYLQGKVEAEIYTLPTKTKLSRQLEDIIDKTKRKDPAFLASQIQVEKRRITKPAHVYNRWIKNFRSVRMSPELQSGILFGLSRYDFWFESISNKASFSLVDAYPGKGSYRYPLVQWMNQVLADLGEDKR